MNLNPVLPKSWNYPDVQKSDFCGSRSRRPAICGPRFATRGPALAMRHTDCDSRGKRTSDEKTDETAPVKCPQADGTWKDAETHTERWRRGAGACGAQSAAHSAQCSPEPSIGQTPRATGAETHAASRQPSADLPGFAQTHTQTVHATQPPQRIALS